MKQNTCCGSQSSGVPANNQTGCCGKTSNAETAIKSKRACCGASEPENVTAEQCGCGSERPIAGMPRQEPWIIGERDTTIGKIPMVSSALSSTDRFSGWKVRWNINRMKYTVRPGVYGMGQPDAQSPVLVTANYKLTFDALRRELTGLSAWILVLDTRGVNVWCAAGKGTFGTDELVARMQSVRLSEVVAHRTLIVPQLGATGVAAHEVQRATGFKVVYGPVRASDIPEFLANKYQKTEAMRTVTFSLRERLAVIPVELIGALKLSGYIFVALLLFRLFNLRWGDELRVFADFWPFVGAILMGTVVFPILLPYLPTTSFALKGALLGIVWGIMISVLGHASLLGGLGTVVLMTAMTSFLTLNFTGTTTFTSLSGAQFEVKTAVPILIVCAVLGLVFRMIA